MKKPYFKNKWKEYNAISPDKFEPMPFDLFMDWRADQWQIPSSIQCIIREQNIETGKVTEHVYTTHGHAKRKVKSIMRKGESEFFLCDHEGITHLFPKEKFNERDYDYEV